MTLLVKQAKKQEIFADMDLKAENLQTNNQIIYLLIKFQESIQQLSKENKELREIMSEYGLDRQENDDNNLDFDTEKIKQLILDNIKTGQIFYPSDIAIKYNVDLMKVVEATNELKKEKKLSDVKENASLS